MSQKKVKVEIEGKVFEYPVIEGTEQEKAFDISKLRDQTGYITMDNGFANTSTCQSAITFLDGEKGGLRQTKAIFLQLPLGGLGPLAFSLA